MTTPSETRAGKLRDIAFAIMNTAESSDECADKVLVDRSLVGQLREALAASEPGEAYSEVRESARHPGSKAIDAAIAQGKQQLQVALDSQIDITNTERGHAERAARKLAELASQAPYGWHVYDGTNRITFDSAEAEYARSEGNKVIPIYTHPVPEQPGKGEAYRAPASPEAMRENQSQPTFMREPQPSDPAEGDALRALIADWRERAKNGPGALNVAAKELEAALSIPPTAAVRIDDEEFRKFDNAVRTWLARRHIQTWDKIRAALDPQVKK